MACRGRLRKVMEWRERLARFFAGRDKHWQRQEEVTIEFFSNPAPCFNRSNICTTIRLDGDQGRISRVVWLLRRRT